MAEIMELQFQIQFFRHCIQTVTYILLVLQSFLRSASSVHDLLKNDARPPHFWCATSLFFGKCCRKVVSSVSSLLFANTDARPMRSSCQEMHQTEHFQAVSCFPTEMLLLHSAGKQWSKPSCASPKKQAENEDTLKEHDQRLRPVRS